MSISINMLIELMGMFLAAGAVYGGIRIDLKNMHAKLDEISLSANDAHKRIDEFLLHRRNDD